MSRVRTVKLTPMSSRGASKTGRARLGFVLITLFQHAFALAPLMLIAVLYLASWRAEALMGHWPRAWVDDPYYNNLDEWLYDFLIGLAGPLLIISMITIILLLPLVVLTFTLKLQYRHPMLHMVFLALAYVLGFIILRLDPGSRILWLMD